MRLGAVPCAPKLVRLSGRVLTTRNHTAMGVDAREAFHMQRIGDEWVACLFPLEGLYLRLPVLIHFLFDDADSAVEAGQFR